MSPKAKEAIQGFLVLIGIAIGMLNLFKDVDFPLQDNYISLTLYFFQFIIVGLLFYVYIITLENFNKVDDISKVPIEAIRKNVDDIVVKKMVQKSRETLLTSRNIWFTIILGWLFLYTFLIAYGLGLIPITVGAKDLVLRIFNYIDTVQFILLYTIFSTSDPKINFLQAVKRNKILIMMLALINVADIFCCYFVENHIIFEIFTVSGALFSSIAFLMFFSRLDSILLQLNKFMLSILILYGILQSFFPVILSNIVKFEGLEIVILFICLIVFSIGKVSLGVFFGFQKYLERSIYFFSSIYFIAPLTNKNMSIGHTFYIKKN